MEGIISSSLPSAPPGPQVEALPRNGLTRRAFLIGLVLCTFMCIALPYNRMVINGSFFSLYYLDRGSIFLFFILVLCLNPLLAVLGRRYILGRGELIAIYIMLLASQSAWWIATAQTLYLPAAVYHASPETPHLQAIPPVALDWLIPQGPGVIRSFYEGLPADTSVPWGAWIGPFWVWGAFLLATCLVLVCLAVILRKQWEEHERLAFPLMEVPLAMGDTTGGVVGPIFKSRLMWAGFGIPFLNGVLRGLHAYYPFVPTIRMGYSFWIFRRVWFPLSLNLALLGYSFFINLDISFSLWIFNLIAKIIRGILVSLGVERGHNTSEVVTWFSSGGSAFMAMMGMGCMLALAFHSVRIAMPHLRAVWAKVLGRPSPLDDASEIISYRTAVIGLLAGLFYMACWLWKAGISPPLAIALLFCALVVFLILARIVNETGFVGAISPIVPSEFLVAILGSSVFNPAGLVTLGFSYAWTATRHNTILPHVSGAIRLAGTVSRKQGLAGAIAVAIAVGLVATACTVLTLGYTHGGINFPYWFNFYDRAPFDAFAGSHLLAPSRPFPLGFLYTALGAGLTLLLLFLRSRLSWWPLHPIALPLATTWYMDGWVFSIFLAWSFKALVLKFGGVKLYRAARPFFIGIILGEVVSAGIWGIIDYFTEMTGNAVYY